MTDTRVQFFDDPHVMQPGSVREYLPDFAAHLAAQGYQSLSISNLPLARFSFRWMDRLQPNSTSNSHERNLDPLSRPSLSMPWSPKAQTRFATIRRQDPILH